MESTNTLTFRDILDASTANLTSGANLTVIDVLVGLGASLICAAIISWTYRASYQGVLYQKSFNLSLILICLAISSAASRLVSNAVLSTFFCLIDLPELISIETKASVGFITR